MNSFIVCSTPHYLSQFTHAIQLFIHVILLVVPPIEGSKVQNIVSRQYLKSL